MNPSSAAIPAVGDAAPDFVYTEAAVNERRLSEVWREGPALVVWLRHLG